MWPFKKKKKKEGPRTVKEPNLRALAAASLNGKFGAWRPQYETLLGELRSGNLSLVRRRCRESSVNSPIIRSLVKEIKSLVVGPGIMVEFNHPIKRHKAMANKLWEAWVSKRDFASDGEQDFYQMQKLIMEEICKAGEVFVKKNYREMDNPAKGIGVEYQIFPADQLADNIAIGTPNVELPDGLAENSKFIDGIGYSKKGRKVGYIFYEDDYSRKSLFSYFNFSHASKKFVPADEIHHVYNRDEARYRRGWPLIGTAIVYGHLGKILDESQLSKQIIAAMFAAFVHDNSAEVALEREKAQQEGEDSGELYDSEISGGTIYKLPTGKDVTFSDAPQNSDYVEFDKSITRKVSASSGAPYESVAGNHSDANYSAARQSQLSADRRMVEIRDDIIIKQFIEPVIQDFKDYLDAMAILPTVGLEHDIFTPGKILIDPAKEVRPKAEEIRAGMKSWSEVVRERGKNPRKVAERIKQDYEMFDELGLQLNTDNRQNMDDTDNQGNEDAPEGREDDA